MSKPIIDIMNQKFILELNAALAMENAGIERLQTRIKEVSLPEAKQQLEHHLEESLEHQKILEQIIISIGGEPTQEKLGLPLPSYPVDMKAMIDKSMTKQEYELKRTDEDMILRCVTRPAPCRTGRKTRPSARWNDKTTGSCRDYTPFQESPLGFVFHALRVQWFLA